MPFTSASPILNTSGVNGLTASASLPAVLSRLAVSRRIPVDLPGFVSLGKRMKRGNGILEAIDKLDSLRVRSGLAIWMRENHDAFADRLSRKLPDWVALAALFGNAGLTDRYGNPPKAETARKTWQRVRKEVKEARARKSVPASTPAVSQPNPGQRHRPSAIKPPRPPIPSIDEEPADDAPQRFTFRPSKPR